MSNGLVLSKPGTAQCRRTPALTPFPKPEASPSGKRGTAAEAVVRTLIQHPSFGDGTGFHFLSGNTGSNEGPIWQAIQDITGMKGLVHGPNEYIALCMASGFEALANADGEGREEDSGSAAARTGRCEVRCRRTRLPGPSAPTVPSC